ncbi:TPA: hypothetical protein HA239_00640 [Candidatus Woesearchaeota archaeon]|nr:hypothetical protein QT06_C0001G0169 [archaeon GW2011_AR15]MBS3104028.1 hypothetical protein [Candidatus Woesearchaeota archaeon]HIH40904.1 hypothetical protein [Candidatus Woesearchaeota archaeon]
MDDKKIDDILSSFTQKGARQASETPRRRRTGSSRTGDSDRHRQMLEEYLRERSSNPDFLESIFEEIRSEPQPREEPVELPSDSSMSSLIKDTFLQIHSKTRKHVNPGELVLKQPLLYSIEGEEAKRYADVVHAITGRRQRRKSFFIDALGHDPDIEGLNNYYIIVSLKQFDSDILGGNYSFKKNLLKKLNKSAAPFIEQITFGEALFGQVKTEISELSLQDILLNIKDYTESIFRLELSLDTAAATVDAVKKIQDSYNDVKKDPDLILKPGYLESMIELSRKPKEIHGQLDRIQLPDVFPVESVEDFIKLRRNGQELYAFRNRKFLFVYFDDSGKLEASYENRSIKLVNGYDTDRVINTLYDFGLVTFSFKRGKEKLEELKMKNRQDIDTFELIKQIKEHNSAIPQEVENFYTVLDTLSHESQADKGLYFKSLPLETKLDLIVPMRADSVLYEIINRSTQTELARAYHKGQPFIEQWQQSSHEQRVGMIKGLAAGISYHDQYNYEVNEWLSKNSAKECREAGIKFVNGGSGE